MGKKLTQEQTDELFRFCRKNNVPHYDLQIELVDHLATDIENRWQQNPELTFNEALKQTYETFGIGGFSAIRETKEELLRKKYRKLQWQYIGEFYKLPKIIFTIFVSLLLFVLYRITVYSSIACFGVIILFSIGLAYYKYYYYKKFLITTVPGKTFMISEIMKSTQGFIASFALIPINAYNIFSINNGIKAVIGNPYIELAMSFYTTFLAFLMIAVSVYIPKKMKEDLTREFPQYIIA